MKPVLLVFIPLFSALLAGCIHEFPNDNPVDPTLVDLRVALAVNIDFEVEAGEAGVEQLAQAYAPLFAEGYRIRYLVDLYETPASAEAPLAQRIRRLTATAGAMPTGGTFRFSETVPLHARRYTALVWVDFVPAGSDGDFYYLTDDLQAVTIAANRPYRGYHVSKDAFAASLPIDLTPYRSMRNVSYEAAVQAKRPFALYQIVATDVAKYRSAHSDALYDAIRPDSASLRYEAYFPMGYNAYRSVFDNLDESGVRYSYEIAETQAQDTAAIIASDFVFVKEAGDFYYVDFSIYTPAGELINTHSHIRVNLQRNRRTVISGEFLTAGSGAGGVGVDFNFEEEIVYVLQ